MKVKYEKSQTCSEALKLFPIFMLKWEFANNLNRWQHVQILSFQKFVLIVVKKDIELPIDKSKKHKPAVNLDAF